MVLTANTGRCRVKSTSDLLLTERQDTADYIIDIGLASPQTVKCPKKDRSAAGRRSFGSAVLLGVTSIIENKAKGLRH